MHVFQIVNNISFDKYAGGAELFALHLANEIATDYKSHLISVWRFGSEQESEIEEKYKSKVTFHFLLDAHIKKKLKLKILVQQIRKLLCEYDPVVINSHSVLPDLINVMIKMHSKKNRKTIRTMHTDRNWINNRFLEGFLLNLIFPFFFSSEVAISRATKTRLDSRCLCKLFHKESNLIPNGIDCSSIANSISPLNQVKDPSKITLVTVGRLTDQKGFSDLIQALGLLIQDHRDLAKKIVLNIFGEGPLKEKLQLQAEEMGVPEIVHFWGYRADVLNHVASSDLFISSSLWEGIPTVMLEAMALKVPIVATDIPGTRELIQDQITGILVPPRDPQRLAVSIVEVISNPDKAEMLSTNALISVKDYRMENVKQKYIELYKK